MGMWHGRGSQDRWAKPLNAQYPGATGRAGSGVWTDFRLRSGVLRFACVKYPSGHRAWIGCSAVGDSGKDIRSPLIGREGPW